MLACLCNNCCLFQLSQVAPNIAWHRFMYCLLHTIFTNKIDRFTDCDGNRRSEYIFTILAYH